MVAYHPLSIGATPMIAIMRRRRNVDVITPEQLGHQVYGELKRAVSVFARWC